MSNLVTDKELLAICNLSNLKMEFADVVLERDLKGNILSNHTIYSLLKKEYKRLKGNLVLTEENVSFY